MGRKILFITTDQQRYDSLGCNGGTIARTPVADGLAAAGVNYRRAYNQNTVCMPARCTILTGQYARTHGVVANGVPLPEDAPSVAAHLRDVGGYRTALVGKAHFEPAFDFTGKWEENRRWRQGETGPWRGFDHSINAMHVASFDGRPIGHYGRWLAEHHPEHLESFGPLLGAAPGGDTMAPETKNNPIPREWYHTDWTANRAIDWLDTVDADEDWFCWVSFPDPHHPWDPPQSEIHRVDWRDVDLPVGYPTSAAEREALLDDKPRHWRLWYDGELVSNYEAPTRWVPSTLTADQVREVNALNAVEVELIDEAIGRVLAAIDARGWTDDVDVVLTTDHGELQGDFGLLFKGPYHVDGLMRLPLVWRPAPSASIAPATVTAPVGLVDLAPTFAGIAGLGPAPWMQGDALPVDDADAAARGIERQLTSWDSELFGVGVYLRTITRDGWVCTAYLPGAVHDGTEGELYSLVDDPLQRTNRWDDPSVRGLRDDLLADLRDHQPPERPERLDLEAPV